jgi:drug/metabolite transporter (DMT)-like permease
MAFLLLNILCSSLVGLLFKYSEQTRLHRYVITTANYVTAAAIGLVLSYSGDLLIPSGDLSLSRFAEEFDRVVWRNNGVFSAESSWIWALIIGITNGFFFLYAVIFFQKSIGENGAALTAMSSRLGVLIPMSVSIVLWNEIPGRWQVIGIGLAIASIVTVTLNFKNHPDDHVQPSLLFLFFHAGAGLFCSKLFQKYGMLEYMNLFLFYIFTAALLMSIRLFIKHPQPVNRKDLLVGILVGIGSLLTNFFMILALSRMQASVVFPLTGAGVIIAMSFGSRLIFGEQLRPRNLVAIGMTLVALVLINI